MSELDNTPQAAINQNKPLDSIVTNCCLNFHAESATTCALCKIPICGNCFEMVEHNTICKTCHSKVLLELANEVATDKHIGLALLGGFAGSTLGAFLWALVTILSGYQIGYAAIGVGFLTGHGVALAVGKRRAFFLQIISAVWSAIGCVLGNLAITIYFIQKNITDPNDKIDYFNYKLWSFAFENYLSNFGFFSAFWIILAIWFSWRISAPRETPMHS